MLTADCIECCKIELSNVALTAVGSLGGAARLGGKAALDVRNSKLQGMNLTTASLDVTVSFISSRFENSLISPGILNPAAVVVNSQFEPALNQTLLNSSVPCSELQRRGTCDRSAVCKDETSDGRLCECPFGFKVDPNDDGSQVKCLDLCDLAAEGIVTADSSMLSRNTTNVVNESSNFGFSNFFARSEKPNMKEKVSVWLVPKNGTRNAPLSDTTAAANLVETGVTSTGVYELQLRSRAESGKTSGTICTLVDSLEVRCTPGYSATDAPGMPCMPIVNLTAASVRITSSTHEVLFDGSSRAPIVAGDKLKLQVEVRDIAGTLVTRSTLGLAMLLEGKLNGNHPAELTPPANGSSTFEVTIPEMWTQEPEEVQLHFLLKSTIVYTLTIQMVENSSKQVAIGSMAAVLLSALLVVMLYVVIKHGAKAQAVILSLVTKEGRMACGVFGEGFDMAGDYGMFFAVQAAFTDTQENHQKAAPVYIPALVSLVVSTVISLLALAVRFTIMFVQIRRRRHELKRFGQRMSYVEQLAIKIEDAQRQCKQTYIGIALALFEQVPMGAIGIFFLSQRYAAPWFPIASVFSSGVMLGTKAAAVTTLPYWWAKVKKWQASARPLGERAALGTELAPTSVESGDAPNGEDGVAALVLCLQELRSHTLRVAHSAEVLALPAKAQADASVTVVAELVKMDHKLAQCCDSLLFAPVVPEPEPEPPMIEVIQCSSLFNLRRLRRTWH